LFKKSTVKLLPHVFTNQSIEQHLWSYYYSACAIFTAAELGFKKN